MPTDIIFFLHIQPRPDSQQTIGASINREVAYRDYSPAASSFRETTASISPDFSPVTVFTKKYFMNTLGAADVGTPFFSSYAVLRSYSSQTSSSGSPICEALLYARLIPLDCGADATYHGFAQLGHERVPEPQPWEPFPIVTMEYVDAQKSAGNLRLRFRLTLSSCSCSRYRLHIKLQLTYPGGGKRPGYMRVFIAEDNCKDDGLVTVLIPDYISMWNLDLPEYKAYYRYTLIDTVTGYRNLAQDLVFGINI